MLHDAPVHEKSMACICSFHIAPEKKLNASSDFFKQDFVLIYMLHFLKLVF